MFLVTAKRGKTTLSIYWMRGGKRSAFTSTKEEKEEKKKKEPPATGDPCSS